jgi:hypothetical protein
MNRLHRYSPLKRKKGVKPTGVPIKRTVNRRYSPIRGSFLEENDVCLTMSLGEGYPLEFWPLIKICEKKACTVHHNERRGKNLLNIDTFRELCAMCHQYLEDHPDYARNIDILITKGRSV